MTSKKDQKSLIKALKAQGFQVRQTGSGHYQVRSPEGRIIAVFGKTPSDSRAFKNAIAQLRRAGFAWPPKGR